MAEQKTITYKDRKVKVSKPKSRKERWKEDWEEARNQILAKLGTDKTKSDWDKGRNSDSAEAAVKEVLKEPYATIQQEKVGDVDPTEWQFLTLSGLKDKTSLTGYEMDKYGDRSDPHVAAVQAAADRLKELGLGKRERLDRWQDVIWTMHSKEYKLASDSEKKTMLIEAVETA